MVRQCDRIEPECELSVHVFRLKRDVDESKQNVEKKVQVFGNGLLDTALQEQQEQGK